MIEFIKAFIIIIPIFNFFNIFKIINLNIIFKGIIINEIYLLRINNKLKKFCKERDYKLIILNFRAWD